MPPAENAAAAIRDALKRQYHAGLAMLGDALQGCDDELWTAADGANAFWQVGYHTVFFTHLYMQPTYESFAPWSGHRVDSQHPDGIAGPADPDSDLPLLPEPYTRDEVLEYWRFLKERTDGDVDRLDVLAAESGFSWYPISKLEHQMVNLRHLQHGAAQLADRLRRHADVGVDWRGSRPADA